MKFNIIASIVVAICMVGSYLLFGSNQQTIEQPQTQQVQPQNTNSGKSFNF